MTMPPQRLDQVLPVVVPHLEARAARQSFISRTHEAGVERPRPRRVGRALHEDAPVAEDEPAHLLESGSAEGARSPSTSPAPRRRSASRARSSGGLAPDLHGIAAAERRDRRRGRVRVVVASGRARRAPRRAAVEPRDLETAGPDVDRQPARRRAPARTRRRASAPPRPEGPRRPARSGRSRRRCRRSRSPGAARRARSAGRASVPAARRARLRARPRRPRRSRARRPAGTRRSARSASRSCPCRRARGRPGDQLARERRVQVGHDAVHRHVGVEAPQARLRGDGLRRAPAQRRPRRRATGAAGSRARRSRGPRP